ncbi:hypothetical protein CB1_012719018 [Camelus ferus]|nr:hypothetical protein CB1_012719018 [Camelus ferus]
MNQYSAYVEPGKQFPAKGSGLWPDELRVKEDKMVGHQTDSQEGVGISNDQERKETTETAIRQQSKDLRANFDALFLWITVGYITVLRVKDSPPGGKGVQLDKHEAQTSVPVPALPTNPTFCLKVRFLLRKREVAFLDPFSSFCCCHFACDAENQV